MKNSKRIEILFLILSIVLTIFLHAHYMSGLYYDQDVAFYAGRSFDISRDKTLLNFRNWGNKPPGIQYIFLLAFYLFGPSFISIQIFALISKVLSVILLYLLAKRLLSKEIKFYFLLPFFFALFSSSEAIQAHTSNLEIFLVPFEIAGILFLGLAAQNKKGIFYFLSGLVLGLGFLIKQSALATCLAGLVFIFAVTAVHREGFYVFVKRAFLFTLVFVTPLVFVSAYYLHLGLDALKSFFRNVFLLNVEYIKNVSQLRNVYLPWSWQQMEKGLKPEIIIYGMFALAGLVSSLKRYRLPERLLVFLWFVITTSVISISGFHLRHHFIEIMAPFLTLSVVGLSDAYRGSVSLLPQKRSFYKIFLAVGIVLFAYPCFHIIAPLIKGRKLENSFFLTQRYLKSPDKERYSGLLLKESYDAARRFLISQYVKEHTEKKDKIFVWDGLAAGSLYLWTGRFSARSETKFNFLPDNLRGPFKIYFVRDRSDYRVWQSRLMKVLAYYRPVYIIVVKSMLPMPSATYPYNQVLVEEKKAFPSFFDFINDNYRLEKEINGCFAYRRIDKDVP